MKLRLLLTLLLVLLFHTAWSQESRTSIAREVSQILSKESTPASPDQLAADICLRVSKKFRLEPRKPAIVEAVGEILAFRRRYRASGALKSHADAIYHDLIAGLISNAPSRPPSESLACPQLKQDLEERLKELIGVIKEYLDCAAANSDFKFPKTYGSHLFSSGFLPAPSPPPGGSYDVEAYEQEASLHPCYEKRQALNEIKDQLEHTSRTLQMFCD